MKKTFFYRFLKDENARIPFSVIGVFLILGASLTTIYISNLENQKSLEIASGIDSSEIESLLRRAEVDMKTALNLAGLKGLKIIGEKPVIVVSGTHDYGDDANTVNENRVKQIIMDEMNLYLKNNYQNNRFRSPNYAINVKINAGEINPIESRADINIEKIKMQYKRKFTISLIGPDESSNYEVYWTADIPINVEITKIKSGTKVVVTERTINVNTLITSRYALLKNLLDEYRDNINGNLCSAWTICTAIMNIYSLARGFQHYSKKDPLNVVDNKDLHIMINAANILQQAFVFGSTDIYAVAGLAFQSDPGIGKNIDEIANSLEEGLEKGQDTYSIATDTIGKDLSDPESEDLNLDFDLGVNISEIAFLPLEKRENIKLIFKNNATNKKETVTLEVDNEDSINEAVSKKTGFTLIEIIRGDSLKNTTTEDLINDVISKIYNAELKIYLKRESFDITLGNNSGFPIDNGTDAWILKSYNLIETKEYKGLGSVKANDILYAEKYEIEYVCNHFWSNKTIDKDGNITWDHLTVEDKRTDLVSLEIRVIKYAESDKSKNDVYNAFERISFSSDLDLNLEDTIQKFKNQNFTNDNKEKWFKNPLNSGTVDSTIIPGTFYNWVFDESWNSLLEIYEEVKKIELDSSITSSKYPFPGDLLEASKTDILNQFYDIKNDLLSESDYKTNDKSNYISTGKKAVYVIREWYVNKIEQDIKNSFDKAINALNSNIDDLLEGKGSDAKSDDMKKALDPGVVNHFKNQIEIPLLAYDNQLKGSWKEDIKIFVKQKPEYLEIDKEILDPREGKTFYPLKIRNTCTLGPTGIPILPPTPVTPWIFTFNLWYIEVKGEYELLKIEDTTDVTHFNKTSGHKEQEYIRQYETILCPDGTELGKNTRLNFEWQTVSLSFVPSFGFMVGDKAGGLIEKTKGF